MLFVACKAARAVFEVVIEQDGFRLTGNVRRQFNLSANALPVTLSYAPRNIYMCDIHREGDLFQYNLEESTLTCLVKNNTDTTGIVHGVAQLTDGSLIFTDCFQRKVKQFNPTNGEVHVFAGDGTERRRYMVQEKGRALYKRLQLSVKGTDCFWWILVPLLLLCSLALQVQ